MENLSFWIKLASWKIKIKPDLNAWILIGSIHVKSRPTIPFVSHSKNLPQLLTEPIFLQTTEMCTAHIVFAALHLT